MDKKDRLKFIRDFIKAAQAITIDQLFAHVPYCEKTLRRDISELNAITSYTHRGKFITLQTIPEFDINGIWFFNDIGFTKYRNSLDLIVHIIAKSKKGITKEELE
ncbi:MAG: DeoR family transcriptional regulator, partial [Cytophagales bacterium]|nr:DeoR family transcriptional regulator [Cytophagales bacterium]